MRSTSKIALAALVGVLAVCAIASASASAACTVKAGSKNYQLCVGGKAVTEVTSIEAPTRLVSNFVLQLPTQWGGTIECTSVSDPAAFETHGLGTALGVKFGQLSVGGCVLQGQLAKKCSAVSVITTNALLGSFESTEGIFVHPETGAEVLAFKLSGSECPVSVRGTHGVSGSYKCQVKEAKVEAVEHELTCGTSTELYTQGEADALHYSQAISLGGTRKGQKFSIYEA
jgi:hypothetical protein